MDMTDAPQASPDYSSFWYPHHRASRVKSAVSLTIRGDAACPVGGQDSFGINSFDCSDLRASQLFATPSYSGRCIAVS
jgi:hypothetical protein